MHIQLALNKLHELKHRNQLPLYLCGIHPLAATILKFYSTLETHN